MTNCIRINPEVLIPLLPQWMKQLDFISAQGIGAADTIGFVKAAIRTLQGEVRFFGWPTSTLRNDVINVKDSGLSNLRQLTVSAPPFVTIEDALANGLGNRR